MKRYHFVGIGGIGMSGLAHILLSRGHPVSGSDLHASSITCELEKRGAHVQIGHNPAHVPEEATVIYTTGVSPNNPEIACAKSRNLPLLHRSKLLCELSEKQKVLAVAGTHGKTTTSALLAWTLTFCGFDPSFAVGGRIQTRSAHGVDGGGEYFVIEADESDGSFLNYHPQAAILTNIGCDHLDYFGTPENVVSAFSQFASQVKESSLLFFCGEDSLLKKVATQGVDYGFYKGATLEGTNCQIEGWQTRFSAQFAGEELGEFTVPLIGRHFALNALAVVGLAHSLGVKKEAIRRGIATFPGVKRRLEKIGEVKKTLLIDDYAHHPNEIEATLSGLRQVIGERRLIALFQPHRYTRTQQCLPQFAEAFTDADLVAVSEIYSAQEDAIEGVTGSRVAEIIGEIAHSVPFDKLVDWVVHKAMPHDVIVLLGAGSITHLGPLLLSSLQDNLNPLRLTLLSGGASPEHEISHQSSAFVQRHLSKTVYSVSPISISQKGVWGEFSKGEKIPPAVFALLTSSDVVFPILHGPNGEDGTIQGLLETLDIPYVGCDHRSAALCSDKVYTKQILQCGNLPIVPFLFFSRLEWKKKQKSLLSAIDEKIGYPLFVKASHLGSSVGVVRVNEEKELPRAVADVLALDTKLLIEPEVKGREIEFAVIGNETPRVFPPGEILSNGKFYDYEAKYGEHSFPSTPFVKLSLPLIEEGMAYAKSAYTQLGCCGMARIDCFLTPSNHYYISEVNPIPGMGSTSLFPKICQNGGVAPAELMDALVISALRRAKEKKK